MKISWAFQSCILISIISIADCNLSALAQTPIPTFQVKQIRVNGSTILEPAQLKTITMPLIDEEVTLEQILQLRAAITNLYIEQGYTTSGAFFPVQDSSDGTVNIQVIEGELEDVEINGLKRLDKSYIKSRIELAAHKPLDINKLEQAIRLLQQNSLVNSVDAKLISGSAPGLSVLKLELVEAPNITTQIAVANDESPNVGEYRATARISHQNLLGFGDRFSAEYSLTEGLDRYGIGYSLPINARDGNLFVGYRNNDSQFTSTLFSPVNIRAESRSLTLGLQQPIIKNPQNELAFSLALDLRKSETFLNDDSFSLEPDRIGESGESKATAIRFNHEWLFRSSQNILAASSQFSLGIDAFNATVNDRNPDGQFFSWLGQLQWLKALNKERDRLLVTKIATQIASDSLFSIEQFALGGLDSVRGYEQNQIIGDNGVFGSVELQIPLIRDTSAIGLVQLVPFIDAGAVWNNRETEDNLHTLASLGVGINWKLKETLSLQAYYGIPVINTEDRRSSLQSEGFHFSLQLVPLKF